MISLGESPANHHHFELSGLKHRGYTLRTSIDTGRSSIDNESRRKSSIDDRFNKPPRLDTSFDAPILLRHDEHTPIAEHDEFSEPTTPDSLHQVSAAASTHYHQVGKNSVSNNNIRNDGHSNQFIVKCVTSIDKIIPTSTACRPVLGGCKTSITTNTISTYN